MISDKEILLIGRFNKPHGINGEISAVFDYDIEPEEMTCIVVKVDDINVPFFITGSRTRGASAWLLSIEGFNSDTDVNELSNHDIYALKAEIGNEEYEEDGMYVSDMIGFKVISSDNNQETGVIVDIEDSTENILFIIKTPDGKTVYVPAADDLIDVLDIDNKIIEMTIPTGLLDL